jgi:phenylpropionate dioxygenase-like ring-hydroxylating dioxygenase large terminal subunit
MTISHTDKAVYWYPVMQSRKLRGKPARVVLNGEALVLFRTSTGISCLRDICPHRFAPLSRGKIVGDSIECPYHGWRFDGSGQCTKIPLYEGPMQKRAVKPFVAQEEFGLIFVTKDAATAVPIHHPKWDDQPYVRKILESDAHTTLEDAVENVLEPVHTLFVHKGLIRGYGSSKSRVTITAKLQSDVLELEFEGEKKQGGLLSRLLEGERSRAVGTFRMPGIVELEYWGKTGLSLVTTLYFTPVSENRYKGFAIMTGPNAYGLGHIKALLFVPIMRKVISQDLRIMSACCENWDEFGRPQPAMSPLDLARKGIEALVRGTPPAPGEYPRSVMLDL